MYGNSAGDREERRGKMLKNQEIRQAAKRAKVRLWEVAEYLMLAQSQLSVMLRHELTDEKKKEIIGAIETIAANR